MEGSIEDVLTVPIQLTERVREAVEEVDSFKQECSEITRQVERLAHMLRSAARVASAGVYERPMRRIVQEVVKSLEKALALVRKCKRSGILKRVITITSATDFRRLSSQLESSIGDVIWLLNVCTAGGGGGGTVSLPPIASTDPTLAWVWGFIASVHNGTLSDKEDAANSLASFAVDNDRNGKIIIEEGGVVPLLRLLKEAQQSVPAQVAAATAIGNLSVDQERVSQIVEEGAIPVMLGILSEGSMRVQAKVSWALSRMVSCDPDCKEAFGQSNAIRPLVSLLSSQIHKDDKVDRNNNLSIHSVVQLGIHRRTASGGNSVGGDQSNHYRGGSSANARREREEEDAAVKLEFKTEVARALWKMAEDSDSNSKRITDTKGLLLLAKFIEKEEGELQENCLKALMEIAAAAERNSDLRRAAFKTNSPAAKAVVEQLLRVVEEGAPHLQIPALKAIGCLARTFPARESRIIKPLVKQLGNREASVAGEAAIALQKFANPTNFLHTEHSKGIIESGGVPPLVRLLKSEEKEVQLPALVLLCYLALHVGNSDALGNAKALSALELASRTSIAQSPVAKELLPRAIKHLEIYQPGSHSQREMYEYT